MAVSQYVQVFVSLTTIAIVLYVVMKVSTVYRQKRYSSEIDIIDRLPLSSTSSLVIVEIRGRQLLLGVTSSAIQLIQEY